MVSDGVLHSVVMCDVPFSAVMLQLVVLKRGTGLLGLKIVGGVDHVCRPFGDGEPGIFVSRVSGGLSNSFVVRGNFSN